MDDAARPAPPTTATPHTTTRPYRSTVRAERAAATRARIIETAHEHFLTAGFRDTSLAAIARAAGTTAQTIHAHFGSKSGILLAIVEQMEVSADAAGWRRRLDAAEDGLARLTAWAGWTVSMLAPSRELAVSLQEAAADPAMRELKEIGDGHRRAGVAGLAATMAERGELRDGLGTDDAADALFILTGLEVYLSAASLGWDDARIVAWLGDALARQLL